MRSGLRTLPETCTGKDRDGPVPVDPRNHLGAHCADVAFLANATFHQEYIRVLTPKDVELLGDESLTAAQKWEKLNHLQRVFKAFNNDRYAVDWQKSADTLTQTLRDLANLEVVE